MARLRFCGFDYEATNGNPINTLGSRSNGLDLDKDFVAVSGSSDTVFYAPGALYSVACGGGRHADSGALGQFGYSALSTISPSLATSCAVPRAAIGSPSQIWATFDIAVYTLSGNADNPATLMRSEARYQIFKFGDLSLRLRRVFNYASNVADVTFEAFNGSTSLGTITVLSVTYTAWLYVRVYAKLDGSTGQFDISIDGQSVSYTGLNSVATTPLASVTHLYFSGGMLGVTSGSNVWLAGLIDNILLDDASFPTGRPSGRRAALATDGTLSGWAATSGGTLVNSLSVYDANKARGTGNGAVALLNTATLSTAGLVGVIGWQVHAYGLSNVDTIAVKKLRTGVDVSGTASNGTYIAAQTPPATPSFISPGLDTIFYSSGTTSFTLANVPNTKIRLEVVS